MRELGTIYGVVIFRHFTILTETQCYFVWLLLFVRVGQLRNVIRNGIVLQVYDWTLHNYKKNVSLR